jgi:hypothetical protein
MATVREKFYQCENSLFDQTYEKVASRFFLPYAITTVLSKWVFSSFVQLIHLDVIE